MADIGTSELGGLAVADLTPVPGQEFPPLEMGLAVGGKLGDMHSVFVSGSDHHQAIPLQVPGLVGEMSFLPSPLQPQTEINPNYIWKDIHTRLDHLWQTMAQDRAGMAAGPEEILKYWGAFKEGHEVDIELRQGKRNLFRRESGEPKLVAVLRDKETGDIVREYSYNELRQMHENRLKSIGAKRVEKVDRLRYLFERNHGRQMQQDGYYALAISNTSEEIAIYNRFGKRFTAEEFDKQLQKDMPNKRTQIQNLEATRGKEAGQKLYFANEFRVNRAIYESLEERQAKATQKAAKLAHERHEIEQKGSWLRGAKNKVDRALFSLGKPLSYGTAALNAALGIIAFDYNPIRPLLGRTVGKAWDKDWAKVLPQGKIHDAVAGLSFKELTNRFVGVFMKDYFTGDVMDLGMPSEKKLRKLSAYTAGTALKMFVLPQYLASLPVVSALNLNPGEIWSMYRSANMVKNTPGSARSFYELMKHADTRGEQSRLALYALAAAPTFLLAEKAAGGGVVNPVLMADMAFMKFMGEVQGYAKQEGGQMTTLGKTGEAVELGITGAFAFDSATSLATRLEAWTRTGSVDPIANVTTEKGLLELLEKHPHVAMGESSIFGRFQRLEHAILAKIRPEMAAQQRMVMVPDEQGEMAHYSVIKEHEDIRVIKSTSDGIAVREQGTWTEIVVPKQPVPKQVPGQELIGLHQRGAEPVREEGAPQGKEHEAQADLAEAQQLAQALIDEAETAVHDYVVFSEDGGLVAMRLDLLAVDDQVDAYESVAQKVDRLFAHVTPMPIGYGIDDADAGLSGEQVKELASGSPELEAIAGADNVYESQLRHAFIDRLLADARANGLTYDLNLVKTRMVVFLEQGFINDRTVEGEVEYASVYRYLFADAQTDFAQADRDTDPKKAYFLTERELNPEIVIEVKSGTTVGQLLSEQGYVYSDLVTEAGTVVYRVVEGQRQPVGWEELDSVYAGDVFVIDRIPDDVERDLDMMPEIIGSGVEPVDASEPGDQHVEPEIILPVELTFDVLRQLDPVRSPDGEIYIGEVQPGQYMSQLVNQRFEGYVENPWATIYRAFEDRHIDLYTVNEQGDVVRDFRESDINSVFAGEKLMIRDVDQVLEGIENYTDRDPSPIYWTHILR